MAEQKTPPSTNTTEARRKEEIDKKRLKLQELRKARQEKQQTATAASITGQPLAVTDATKENSRSSPLPVRDLKDLDDLIFSLVGDKNTQSRTKPVDAEKIKESIQREPLKERNFPQMSEVETLIFDFPPKERELYNKEVQTARSSFDMPVSNENDIRGKVAAEREKEKERQHHVKEEKKKDMAEAEQRKSNTEVKLELTDTQRKAVLSSPGFLNFFDHTSKMVERALNDTYDFMKDYSLETVRETEQSGLKQHCAFSDEKTKHRNVTDVNWSLKHPELLLASYDKNTFGVTDSDGLVCIWNLHLLERPEYVFHSQSAVLCADFSPFHPNLIVGGTYSGQVLLWDTRSKHLPVLKTPLSAGGHTHPVYSMSIVGTQNAHHLMTASTDGLVCSWQMDMLSQPQETLELLHSAHPKSDEVAITTMRVPENETGSIWVGTEEGCMYQANRHDRAGSKAGINLNDIYRGHVGMITGMSFHPLVGPVDFSNLVLTCSVDWTVKLWRIKSPAKPSATLNPISPLRSFEESADCVYDARWSPIHPAVFGSVDGSGKLDLWNLNTDIEVPVVSTIVGSGRALNKLAWAKDGRKVATGSSDGRVYVFDVGESFQPRTEDWVTLQKSLHSLDIGGK